MKNAESSGLKTFVTILILSALLLTSGCAGKAPPLAYQYLTTALVIESLRNSPQATAKVKVFQPMICELATGQVVDPTVFAQEMSGVTKDDKQAQALANGLLALYIGAIGTSEPTNIAKASPYAQAIFCPGLWNGLVALEHPPAAVMRSRNAPPEKAKWPLVR